MTIRVIVADDHRIVREGLVALLQREDDIEVIAEARDGMELVRQARELQPDVVLVDLSMPRMNGVEAIRRIRAEPLRCKLLCLSVHEQPQQVLAALEAGASGYVLKENSFDELARGVRRVMADQIYLSGELVGLVLQGSRRPAQAGAKAGDLARLTPREREMVQLLSEGYTAQQIAQQLHLSAKTVATHREHVFAKLQIQGIAELTRFALREGLSSLDAQPPRG
ncbi:response regulator transcription factor [Paucibacter sp. XJ19-41]|uniref:response regulator transcription factor n=1 Tax=Paucibacter sp. XJ19-41 TaxID=2927824 RepID=UPI00234B1407|nr:response regulator transcription factor [Paucibacter sp. XJ19-41]MDC6169148.1 response regulator transcription factor [Paucibacter sp. XJ19-41]